MRARTVAVLGIVVALVGGVVARVKRKKGTVAEPVRRPADDTRSGELWPEPGVGARASRPERPAYAPPVRAFAGGAAPSTLRGISEIRRFFRTNETPIWFVSATPFNLLGIDRWVRNFSYLNYYDSFDGTHPNVFVPQARRAADVRVDRGDLQLPPRPQGGDRPRQGERGRQGGLPDVRRGDGAACREAGSRLRSPPPSSGTGSTRRSSPPSSATRRACRACRTSSAAPTTYGELLALAAERGIGTDLVVQTPYGDSGQTTFFVASEDDWDENEDKIVGQELKVMKRINCREAAIEGVITRHGTLVGPLMTELTGFPELTPYGGGWCGNDVFAAALSEEHRRQARAFTQRWATGCVRRATAVTSSSTSWPTWTRARCSSASSTRA